MNDVLLRYLWLLVRITLWNRAANVNEARQDHFFLLVAQLVEHLLALLLPALNLLDGKLLLLNLDLLLDRA